MPSARDIRGGRNRCPSRPAIVRGRTRRRPNLRSDAGAMHRRPIGGSAPRRRLSRTLGCAAMRGRLLSIHGLLFSLAALGPLALMAMRALGRSRSGRLGIRARDRLDLWRHGFAGGAVMDGKTVVL